LFCSILSLAGIQNQNLQQLLLGPRVALEKMVKESVYQSIDLYGQHYIPRHGCHRKDRGILRAPPLVQTTISPPIKDQDDHNPLLLQCIQIELA